MMLPSILIYTSYYLPGFKGGGPIRSISNLVAELCNDFEITIVTQDRDLGDIEPYSRNAISALRLPSNVKIIYTKPGFFSLLRSIFIINIGFDVVYVNSFFSIKYSLLPVLFAKIYGSPVLLAPRGEFSPGALAINKIIKSIYIKLYRLLGIHRGVLFQASNHIDRDYFFDVLGSSLNVVVADNISSSCIIERIPQQNNQYLKVVFLSRVFPKKNLLFALNVLGKINFPVIFDVYGPLEDKNYWGLCDNAVASLPENIVFTYKGPISPNEAVSVLSNYDVFFFPTLGENYGHVIAEALMSGLILLISDRTPWVNLNDKGLGWDLPLDSIDEFINSLNVLCQLDYPELLKRKEHVLAIAKEFVSANLAVTKTKEMFFSIVNK